MVVGVTEPPEGPYPAGFFTKIGKRIVWMAETEFNCPFCSKPFLADGSGGDIEVSCPHCAGTVSIRGTGMAPPGPAPPGLAPPGLAPPALAPPALDSTAGGSLAGPPPPQPTSPPEVDTGTAFPAEGASDAPMNLHAPVRVVGAGDHTRELRELSAEEREARRFWKNIAMWFFGALVLVGALWLLL